MLDTREPARAAAVVLGMEARDEDRVPRLGAPMSVAAAGAATVVAAVTRWWYLGLWNAPLAIIVAAGAGFWLGRVMTDSLRAEPLSVTVRRSLVFVAIVGPIAALAVWMICDVDVHPTLVASVGASVAAALVPCVVASLWLARVALRARLRSLVGLSDRRAAWRVAGAWLALVAAAGTVPSRIDCRDEGVLAQIFWWSEADKLGLAFAPWFVALVACAIAAIVAALDARALWLVSGAHRVSAACRSEPGRAPGASLDVGIGHDAWLAEVSGTASYRQHVLERVVAVGDLASGTLLLRRALARSVIALLVAAASAALTTRAIL